MKTVVARMDEYMVKLGANIGKLTKEVDHDDDHEVQTQSSALNDYTFELPINEKISGQASIMGNDHLKLKPYQVIITLSAQFCPSLEEKQCQVVGIYFRRICTMLLVISVARFSHGVSNEFTSL